jgi:hypothetical protein
MAVHMVVEFVARYKPRNMKATAHVTGLVEQARAERATAEFSQPGVRRQRRRWHPRAREYTGCIAAIERDLAAEDFRRRVAHEQLLYRLIAFLYHAQAEHVGTACTNARRQRTGLGKRVFHLAWQSFSGFQWLPFVQCVVHQDIEKQYWTGFTGLTGFLFDLRTGPEVLSLELADSSSPCMRLFFKSC